MLEQPTTFIISVCISYRLVPIEDDTSSSYLVSIIDNFDIVIHVINKFTHIIYLK